MKYAGLRHRDLALRTMVVQRGLRGETRTCASLCTGCWYLVVATWLRQPITINCYLPSVVFYLHYFNVFKPVERSVRLTLVKSLRLASIAAPPVCNKPFR